MKSKILWTDKTWNPMTGCTKVSPACDNCYAERMSKRLKAMCANGYENGFKPTVHFEKFNECRSWKKPKKVFVNSMSDTFHEAFTISEIASLFACMASAETQTFQILTKRSERLAGMCHILNWPKNIWCGITVENQEMANERIPHLLSVPAAVRFVSVEPMLGPVDLGIACANSAEWSKPEIRRDGQFCVGHATRLLDWVICGGESGPNARPMNPDWARSLRDQCVTADVPFFFKQWGEWRPVDSVKDNYKMIGMPSNCGCNFVHRTGKKIAGRLLDGREWNQFPEVETI